MRDTLHNRVKEMRGRQGLSQDDVARAIGVTRQAVSAIESGNSCPSTLISLKLAKLFNCRIEEIFWTPDSERPMVHAAYVPGTGGQMPSQETRRVALSRIDGRIVARPMEFADGGSLPTAPAHGIAVHVTDHSADVELLVHKADVEHHVFLAGCDIGLGLLARHVEHHDPRQSMYWSNVNNREAVMELYDGHAHIAAVHYRRGREQGDVRLPHLEGLMANMPFEVYRFAEWEQGFMVRPGNPKHFHDAADLERPDIRLANRSAGAGARDLLDEEIARYGLLPEQIHGYATELASHLAVGDAIRNGLADAGIGLSSVAALLGLDFIPLRHECCDLIVPGHSLSNESVRSVLHTLNEGVFRKDLQSFGPYETGHTGKRITP